VLPVAQASRPVSGLFLCRHLLFNVAPGADLETPAYPAKRLRRGCGGFPTANRAFSRFLQPVGRNRLFRLLQYLGWDYRLQLGLWFPSHPSLSSVSLWQKQRPGHNYYSAKCVLSRFRNLYYNSNIQRRPTPRTPLPCGYARILPFHINVGRNRMRADWAMYVADTVIFNKCFHERSPHFIRRENPSNGCTKIVKILHRIRRL
jgi:hypothetical protein